MIVGTGIDIVEVERIREALQGNTAMEKKVFTEAEIAYCREHKNCFQHFAGRFAAKEAALKALGTGWSEGIRWKDVEVTSGEKGKPEISFYRKALKIFSDSAAEQAVVSITHSSEHAISVVILER